MMKITKEVVGYLQENCYILEIDDNILIVDPGDAADKIKKHTSYKRILGILVTHSHMDHIGALKDFKDIPVYSFNNLEEKEYNIGPFRFEVIFNPGHSKDSASYYFREDNTLFSGDFIFLESIGRCDLPGGDINEMKKSINMIKNYPKTTIIYPGHGNNTNLEYEINNNIYFSEDYIWRE